MGVCVASTCLIGGGAAAVAALAVAPMPPAEGVGPGVPAGAPGAPLRIVRQVPVEFPTGLTSDFRRATLEFTADVAEDGSVSAVHLARVVAHDDRELVPEGTPDEANGAREAQAAEATRTISRLGLRLEGVERDGPAAGPIERLGVAAADAIRQWRFEPPAAQPAQVRVEVTYDFRTSSGRVGPAQPVAGFARGARPAPPRDALRVGGAIKH